MNRFKALILTAVTTALLLTGCGNNEEKEYISKDVACQIALNQADGVFEEDVSSCELIDAGLQNKIYRVTSIFKNLVCYEVDIDGISGEVLQVESETLTAGNQPSDQEPTKDIGKEEIKKIIFKQVPGTSEFNVLRCEYCLLEDGTSYYDCLVYLNENLYSFKIDSSTGEVIESDVKNIGEKENDTLNVEGVHKSLNAAIKSMQVKYAANSNTQKPVWILGHRCNTNYHYNHNKKSGDYLSDDNRDIKRALDGGCNGVEVDIQHRSCDDTLRLNHTATTIGYSESVEEFLSLPDFNDPRLCVVVFDIKDKEPNNVLKTLINIVHNFQNKRDASSHALIDRFAPLDSNKKVVEGLSHDIVFVYSFSDVSDANKYFKDALPLLWANETLCVDMDNDVDGVKNLYENIKLNRGWYGRGIFTDIFFTRRMKKAVQKAVQYRDSNIGQYKFAKVETWTVTNFSDLKARLDLGADVVMCDPPLTFHALHFYERYSDKIRKATRNDLALGKRYTNLDYIIEEGDYAFRLASDSTKVIGADSSYIPSSLLNIGYNNTLSEGAIFTIKKDPIFGSGTYTIQNKKTGLYLTFMTRNDGVVGSGDVTMEKFTNRAYQKWSFERKSYGTNNVYIKPIFIDGALVQDMLEQ